MDVNMVYPKLNCIEDNYSSMIDKFLKDHIPTIPLNPCYGITKTNPKVEKAIFNPPATVIIWNDGTKSVVKCQNGEPFDAEKGFALAYLKKLLGNDNTFNKEIKKWVKWEEPVEAKIDPNVPLTIEQLMKMDGKKIYVVSLDINGQEDFAPAYSGWRMVDVRKNKLYNDKGEYYTLTSINTDFGYHAYLTEKKKV